MHAFKKIAIGGAAGALVALLLSGCVTAKKYRLASAATVPTALNWSVASPPAKLTLKNVIVIKGPGSWKREARWDEYVVELRNVSDRAMRIDSAVLVDLLGVDQFPGTEPWKLEKFSYTNWDKYGKSGLKLLAGAGVVTLYVGAAVSTATTGLLAEGASAGGGAALLSVVPVAAVMDVTVVAIMNHQNKAKVEAEFQRRRLPFPTTVAAGATVTGSLFFPMTPGPRRLVVTGHVGESVIILALDLTPLSSLHLRPHRG